MPFEVVATPKLGRDTLWQTNENLDDIKFGFEFEFASDIDRDDFASNLEDTLGITSSQIRIKNGYESSSSRKDYSKWGVEGDGSIPLHGDQIDIELVSPPRSIAFWEDNLKDVLDLIDRSGQVWTGTGLHITFSYANLENLDPLKFALFINDVNIAKLFGRGLHSYSKLYLSRVKSNITREFGHVSGADLPGVLRRLRKTQPEYIYTTQKFSSINLSKLHNNTPLIEIRSPGGADYVSQAEDILRTCRIIASALIVACSDTEYADVYAHKFGKLLATEGQLVQEGANTEIDAYVFTSTVNGAAVDMQANNGMLRYRDPKGHAHITINLGNSSCGVESDNLDSPAWVSRVLPAIVKCPVGANFPGVPDDLYLKVTAVLNNMSDDDRNTAEYIGSAYYHRPAKMTLHPSIEEYLKKSIKPTADSILAIVNTVTNGGSVSPIQADYLLGAFYKTQGKPSDIPFTPDVVAQLRDHLDILVPAVVRYAASTADVAVFAKTIAMVADSNLVNESVVVGAIHSFVDKVNLQDSVTNGSLLTAPLTLKHHTDVPAKYVDIFDAAVKVKIADYISTAQPQILGSIVLNALRAAHTRDTLNTSVMALFSYPSLVPVVKDKIGDFGSLASIGIKNLSDYIWVVDILPINDTDKLSIWAKQSLSCTANATRALSASVDPDLLHKWVLASAQNTEAKNVALKKNAVILFGAILHQGPAALAAYDAIMGMYVALPDNLRDQLTRYVFQQLQEAGISSPRQAMWRVLVKYITATLHGLAELQTEDAKILQRSRNLVMFLDESDRYLGSGSSYWRADRRQHVADLNNILSLGGSINDGHATVGMLSDVEPGSTVTIESHHNNEDDVVSPVVLPYIIEYVRGIKEAIKNIESRPTA